MLDGETVAREIPDLDGDGVAESWETRRDLCGSGGCTYTIHLSSHSDETLGEVFGVNFTPFSSLYLDGPRPPTRIRPSTPRRGAATATTPSRG